MIHRLTNLLVERRKVIFVVMLLSAIGCGLLMPHINVNTDMTKYLPTDSPMKQGLEEMKEAFHEMDMNTFSLRAMYRDLDTLQQQQLADSLRKLEGVALLTAVRNNDPYTLYELTLDSDSDPKLLAADLKGSGREVLVETSIDGNLPDTIVFIIAGILVFAILFLMSQSWMEPLIYLITIGIAVVLNVGSNALLPSVSMTTNAIVAILQLVLSMDYSIILSNRFRQEKTRHETRSEAMKYALCNATPSVLSSALTTIVGMLMLCFMKFRIGLDLGIVLAKGVFCSIFCLYTVLPSLLLMFDSVVEKTSKRIFLPNTDRLARFEYRFRIPLAIATLVICMGSYLLHNLTPITFSTNWPTAISDVFPRKNTVVMLYDNADEAAVIAWADSLCEDPMVDTVVAYPTLLMRQQTPEAMAASLQGLVPMMPPEAATMVDEYLTPDMLALVLDMMDRNALPTVAVQSSVVLPKSNKVVTPTPIVAHQATIDTMLKADDSTVTTTATEYVTADTLANKDTVAESNSAEHRLVAVSTVPSVDEPTVATAETTADASYLDTILMPMGSAALSKYLGFKAKQAYALFKLANRTTMSPYEFVHYVTSSILPNKVYSKFISHQQRQQLIALQHHMDQTVAQASSPKAVTAVQADTSGRRNKPYPLKILNELESIATQPAEPTPQSKAVVASQAVTKPTTPSITIPVPTPKVSAENASKIHTTSIAELLDFITNDLVNDPELGMMIPDTLRGQLGSVQGMMEEGLGQIRGKHRSIAAIVTSYPDEGDSTQHFLQQLRHHCDEVFGTRYRLIGESVMFDEMRQGFNHELLVVTLLTILAIYLIVAITFRSLVLPIILIATVLSGVYINVFVSGLGNGGLLYLAYLIVQSILMGATIDYAILFSNYYREKRRVHNIPTSLMEAYRGSIHTIATSGLIIVCAPGALALLVEDRTIASIVSSLAIGGAAAIILILFVLPGVLAAMDRFVVTKRHHDD